MGPRDRPHLTPQRLPPPFAATPHRRTTSGAPCWPSPRASTSSTDRGRRTRHCHQRIDDVSPERIRQDWAVSRPSTPPPITRPPPTAQCRGKGGPQAHPAGTRSALPAAGAVGEAPAGVGAGAVVRAVSEATAAVAPVRTQSADGPQNGQNRPTTAASDHRQKCWSSRVSSHSPLCQTTPRSILQGGG